MSIQQVSNNRPSGSTAKSCDAGIPIAGRTSSTGVYEILKLNADGSLSTGGSPSTVVPYTLQPTAFPLNPVGAFGVGVITHYAQITTSSINAGMYTINPSYIVETLTVGGAVNIALIKQGSTIDAYTGTRNVGTDDFNPAAIDLTTGFVALWHNLPLERLSTNFAATANLNATAKSMYLSSGTYALLVFVYTTFTTTAPTTYVGFTEFSQIS